MTYLSKACAAPVLVQAGALEAEAQTPPAPRSKIDELLDSILKEQDKRPKIQPASSPAAVNLEAVRAKIRPCWIPVGGKSATVVAIRVEMNRDATTARAEVQDKTRYAADADLKQAADVAYRAVMNPRCQPWPLPPEKYDTWRTITFKFDPRDY